MGKEINKILYPKTSGLTGKNKPVALVVHSPYDDGAVNASVGYKASVSFLEGIGYGSMSKAKLT